MSEATEAKITLDEFLEWLGEQEPDNIRDSIDIRGAYTMLNRFFDEKLEEDGDGDNG